MYNHNIYTVIMVRCANIITRIGSKQNDIKFFKQYLPLDVKTVVEPFAGSFAGSSSVVASSSAASSTGT